MKDSEHPACLMLQHDDRPYRVGTRFDLPKSPTFLGRAPDADVVLRAVTVARRHCRFERRAGAWWVVDERSPGGTHVNDQRITERRLETGDQIAFGGLTLRFLTGPALDAACARERRRLVAADARSACLVLLDAAGPHAAGARFDLGKSPTHLGREEGADIVIPADVFSSHQCHFELREGAWWISDEGSTGGTFVNHESVGYQGERRLADGDLLTFGWIGMMFLTADE